MSIIDRFLRARTLFLTIFFILLGLSAYKATTLEFYYDLNSFFPAKDGNRQFLVDFQKRFESDDAFVLVAVERNNESVFDSTFLAKFHKLTKQLDSIPNVEFAQSVTTIQEPIFSPSGGSIMLPVLRYKQPQHYKADSARLAADPRWNSYLISKSGYSLTAFLRSKNNLTVTESNVLSNTIDSVVASHGFYKTHVVGRAKAQVVFIKRIEKELSFYIVTGLLMLILIMALVFRSFWGVVIPVFSCVSGLILFLGYLGAIGHKLDIMSVLYPVLVLTIGMSDIIHIMNKYISEQGRLLDRRAAMKITLREIGLATLLTCVCTVIGFAASLTTNIKPIQTFSINAAIGIVIAYLNVIFFTSHFLTLFPGHKLTSTTGSYERFWSKFVNAFYFLGKRYPARILTICGVVLLICIYGASTVTTNTYVISDVPKSDDLRTDFVYFEKEFSGARPIEIALLPKNNRPITHPEVIKQVNTFHNYLDSLPHVGAVVSPATVYRTLHKSFSSGDPDSFALPQDPATLAQYSNMVGKLPSSMGLGAVIDSTKTTGRLTARVTDIGSIYIKQMNQDITKWANANIDTNILKIRHTGTALLLDQNNDYLVANLFQGLAIAFALIAIIIALLFRNLRMVIISLIPNIFPLLICAAVMGFSGIELKSSTAIIFEIVFGIAVDDTIHFLTQFKLETRQGRPIQLALKNTFRETGKAIILTSLILFSGFITMVFSDFTATYYIGLLMGITFVTAVLSDLFILPILLSKFKVGSLGHQKVARSSTTH